jgi:hypothetical protein
MSRPDPPAHPHLSGSTKASLTPASRACIGLTPRTSDTAEPRAWLPISARQSDLHSLRTAPNALRRFGSTPRQSRKPDRVHAQRAAPTRRRSPRWSPALRSHARPRAETARPARCCLADAPPPRGAPTTSFAQARVASSNLNSRSSCFSGDPFAKGGPRSSRFCAQRIRGKFARHRSRPRKSCGFSVTTCVSAQWPFCAQSTNAPFKIRTAHRLQPTGVDEWRDDARALGFRGCADRVLSRF